MKLNDKFLSTLGATAGAGSRVTDDEYKKKQITLVTDETEVLLKYLSKSKVFRGNVATGGAKAQQRFLLYRGIEEIGPIDPHLVFPKPEKDELRLYLSEAAFHPSAGSIWYVFRRKDGRLCLGYASKEEFDLLGKGWVTPTTEASEDEGDDREGHAKDILERTRTSILARRGQAKFRQALRARYDDSCCITGSTIVGVLEAAHLGLQSGADNNNPENGLLLRSDLHTLFDLGLIGIHPETFRIAIHPSLNGSEYEEYEGTLLRTNGKKVFADGLQSRWEMLDWIS